MIYIGINKYTYVQNILLIHVYGIRHNYLFPMKQEVSLTATMLRLEALVSPTCKGPRQSTKTFVSTTSARVQRYCISQVKIHLLPLTCDV